MGPIQQRIDFTIFVEYGAGSTVYLLRPISTRAKIWTREHLPADAPRLGGALAVEHRYIVDIISGMQRDGLVGL